MSDFSDARCPECGGALEAGYIGYFSGIVWSESEPEAWQRLIPFVFGATRFIIGSWGSTPWIRSRAARKCRDCGALVIPATGD
jgi:hypothetical protein